MLWGIIGLIVVLAIAEILYFYPKGKSIKSTVTIVGVLGTFIGIVIGLWDFDYVHIENSLPTLLSGLTTAFLTSVAGMVAFLVLTIIEKFRERERKETFVDILSDIRYEIRNVNYRLASLDSKLETGNQKLESLDSKLDTYAEFSKKAKEFFPTIETGIENMSSSIAISFKDISKNVANETEKISAKFEEIAEKTDTTLSKANKSISNNLKEISKNMNSLSEEISKKRDW
jgi:methyl-accepting chemotaxis protein